MKPKYRHELKYILSEDVARILDLRLRAVMQRDRHSISDDYSYFIRSLYFDTIDNDALAEKLDGVQFRKKYRLRFYNHNASLIKLECKHKHGQMTFKEAVTVNQSWVKQVLSDPYNILVIKNERLDDQFMIDYRLQAYRPSVIVDYYRQAYVFEPLDVRITLDYHVSSGVYNMDLFDSESVSVPVFEKNQVVLEIKFNEVLPDFVWGVLQTVPALRMAISKFAYCRNVL